MKTNILAIVFLFAFQAASAQTADEIIAKVDKNMSADTRIVESTMTVYGARTSRTMTSISYTQGTEKAFSEYLSPAREKGTKMLKIGKEMWVYSPSTDRTIMISGSMLRQSVMGSDLSYEDMMDDRKLTDIYTATLLGTEVYDGRKCFLIELKAKVSDVAYASQKLWVDSERFLPLKEELYAKSGKLLKQVTMSDMRQVQGRWFPFKMNYKDMLKDGKGTDWIITRISFNAAIPASVFNKGNLK